MDTDSVLPVLISLLCGGFFIFAIIASIGLIKKSNEQAKQSEMKVNMLIAKLPQDKQMVFMMQYNNSKKNPTTAVLLALFIGGLGIHKFYLGNAGMGILYLLFCWTSIPAWIALGEAFTIAGKVGQYNEQKANEIAALLGI